MLPNDPGDPPWPPRSIPKSMARFKHGTKHGGESVAFRWTKAGKSAKVGRALDLASQGGVDLLTRLSTRS